MRLTRAVVQYSKFEISMGHLLKVDNLVTKFHTPEGIVHAVNGVSFHVDDGETLAVVGESACGKTVTMLSILGLIPIPPGEISSGSALYTNRDLLQLSEDEIESIRGREIAMIFQDSMTSLNPVLTIGRQMTESLIVHLGFSHEKAVERAIEMLTAVGIPDAKNRLSEYPHQFSGGMRQRVMIAMALSCAPSLVIADEPTTALDVTIQSQIVELVIRFQEELGMSLIWITHDLGVVAGVADRVIVMYSGIILEEAVVDELYEAPLHPYTNALLAALPRIDQETHEPLLSIPGAPPNLLIKPKYCPFAPRCKYVRDICRQSIPPLEMVDVNHQVACWVNIETGELR